MTVPEFFTEGNVESIRLILKTGHRLLVAETTLFVVTRICFVFAQVELARFSRHTLAGVMAKLVFVLTADCGLNASAVACGDELWVMLKTKIEDVTVSVYALLLSSFLLKL